MSYLKDLVRAQKKLAAEQERKRKQSTRFGLFHWRGDGRYKQSAAIRTYKSEKVADKAARKLGGDVVVRPIRSNPRAKVRSARVKNPCKRRRNPRRAVVIGEFAESITYQGGLGKGKRSRWRHPFQRDSHAQVLGLPDGSIKIVSKAGKRLWDFFEVD